MQVRHLLPLEFPSVTRELEYPPRALSVAGDFTPAKLVVAIVGARKATTASLRLARRLAEIVVRAGGVVISGGANGVDTAAHLGALRAGGRTWSVLGCGAPIFTPKENRRRFQTLLREGGAIIWTYPPETEPAPQQFTRRNGVIMALAHVAVVVQARAGSGSLNAAHHAKTLKRPLWVVPGMGAQFAGSWQLIEEGARVLRSEDEFAASLSPTELDGDALTVLNALGSRGKHPDEIAVETGLSTPAVTTALLTLALGDVVVEGSAGLYQRK